MADYRKYTVVTYVSETSLAISNAFGDSFVEEFSLGIRIRADCGTDGIIKGTVGVVAFAAGVTTVTIVCDSGALTANLVWVTHGADSPDSLANHGHTGQADGGLLDLDALGVARKAYVDAFIATRAAALGLATLNEAQLVVQNPASASGVPAPLKIPIADGGGLLDAWVTAFKPVIQANTTIYVATTGSDTTGTGLAGAPFASIGQALFSIRNKVIAAGIIVIIQLADGTYTILSTITVDHPDADKIRIYGNTGAETVIAIAALDTGTSKITVAGDQTAVSGLFAGAILHIVGSSTAGLNGSYTVSTVTVAGGNTEIVTTQAIPSATVGGGSIRCKPANRCVLVCASGVVGFTITKPLYSISGIRLNCGGGTSYGVYVATSSSRLYSVIADGFQNGFMVSYMAYLTMNSCVAINCQCGVTSQVGSNVMFLSNPCTFSFCSVAGLRARQFSFILAAPSLTNVNGNAADYAPALNVNGNSGALIATS